MADILVDSSFLVALMAPRDKFHARASRFASSQTDRLLVPDVTIPKVAYNLEDDGGQRTIVRTIRSLISNQVPLVALTPPDLSRAADIMEVYAQARLDIVDCCIAALAERLSITRICTFDRRDFSIIRPAHADYFELLP